MFAAMIYGSREYGRLQVSEVDNPVDGPKITLVAVKSTTLNRVYLSQ